MSGGLDRPAQHSYDPKRTRFRTVWNVDLKALWVRARGAFFYGYAKVVPVRQRLRKTLLSVAIKPPQHSNTTWRYEPCDGSDNQAVVPSRHALYASDL